MRRANAAAVLLAGVTAGCLSDMPGPARGRGYGDGTSSYDESGSPEAPGLGGSVSFAQPPYFGDTVRQADPPPPLSGGTLAIAGDGTVVVADPDRDRVYLVDVAARAFRKVTLLAHDEPGRVAIDEAGRAHVVLRGAGALATIDLVSGALLARRAVCAAPRGVAYESAAEAVHVACAGGELVTLPASGGDPTSVRRVADDLRDVVVTKDGLFATTFRTSRLLRVQAVGDPVDLDVVAEVGTSSRVAWRMIREPARDSGVMFVAQQSSDQPVPEPAGYYVADPCGTTGGAVTSVHAGGEVVTVPNTPLPVDIAATLSVIAIAVAGNGHTAMYPQIVALQRGLGSGCDPGAPAALAAQITSLGFLDEATLVAFSREPAAVFVLAVQGGAALETKTRIDLGEPSREDTGHAIFHSNAGLGMACASCHPEGRDDGNAWLSNELGHRRTPSLLGTLAGTAPYHWNGEAADMPALARLTFESRMKGPTLAADQIDALGGWLVALPPLPASPPVDADAVTRGHVVFTGACGSCHAGSMLTNNRSLDVGTGGAFQVPSLVGVASRPPYLHDGRASSLSAAIRGHQGASLSEDTLADIVAFVRTL